MTAPVPAVPGESEERLRQAAAINRDKPRKPWCAGDPCGSCGSTDTGEGLPREGAFCRTCGRSDDDD